MITDEQRKKAIAKIKELEEKESRGLFFSDKGSYPALNTLDALKKSACDLFSHYVNKSELNDNEVVNRCSAFGVLELSAIYNHRTEQLTLERILILYDRFAGTSELDKIKKSAIAILGADKFSGKELSNLSIDYLVQDICLLGENKADKLKLSSKTIP
jgi:hypothetical protein